VLLEAGELAAFLCDLWLVDDVLDFALCVCLAGAEEDEEAGAADDWS
jgi:hypothetical protein